MPITIVKGLPIKPQATLFAEGSDIATQDMRLEYEYLNAMEPTAKFPTIHRTNGDGSIASLGLTPAEGRWLRDALNALFADSEKVAG